MGCSDDSAPTATAPCCRRSCNLLSPGRACAARRRGRPNRHGRNPISQAFRGGMGV